MPKKRAGTSTNIPLHSRNITVFYREAPNYTATEFQAKFNPMIRTQSRKNDIVRSLIIGSYEHGKNFLAQDFYDPAYPAKVTRKYCVLGVMCDLNPKVNLVRVRDGVVTELVYTDMSANNPKAIEEEYFRGIKTPRKYDKVAVSILPGAVAEDLFGDQDCVQPYIIFTESDEFWLRTSVSGGRGRSKHYVLDFLDEYDLRGFDTALSKDNRRLFAISLTRLNDIMIPFPALGSLIDRYM